MWSISGYLSEAAGAGTMRTASPSSGHPTGAMMYSMFSSFMSNLSVSTSTFLSQKK